METRESRHNYEPNNNGSSRLEKNKNLYTDLNHDTLDNFDIHSNTSIIGDQDENQIDVEKIKKILDTRYNTSQQNTVIEKEPTAEEIQKDLENTREYDINAILNKAKTDNVISYEEEKKKKNLNTHYDILKNLDEIVKEEEIEEEVTESDSFGLLSELEESNNIVDLINTIVVNEENKKEEYTNVALDLFEDLKEDDDEIKLKSEKIDQAIKTIEKKEKIEQALEKTKSINMERIKEAEREEIQKEKIKSDDFEKLYDNDEPGETGIIIKIILVLLIIGFIVGMYLFIEAFLTIQ